ncbi:MAG: gluconate 2-dehydrogenase subunit 3 family protein [Steroidobacteraceae bacterium]
MDRRTTIKWVLAASATWPALAPRIGRADPVVAWQIGASPGHGYGTDPNLLPAHHPGEYWPLTLSAAQRRLATVLSDLILPADEHSPSASQVGVVDFIDEWVSAPYPDNQRDRPIVLEGLAWLDAQATRRLGKGFADLESAAQRGICDEICDLSRASPERTAAAHFFARYRDLTAGGFYSSAAGRKDVGYIGNVPLPRFDGPPRELLAKLNLL